jgi:hypothetical protein
MPKIIRLEIDPDNFTGVDAISLVEFPAIEENFQVFSKPKAKNVFLAAKIIEEKRLVIGPAMIPDKMIFRINQETGEEYYVYFDKATVRQSAYEYLKANRQHMATVEHEVSVKGVTLVESWIVEGKQDKSFHLGYEVPVGTWMVAMRVENDEVWALAKKGSVKGFSIEGWFTESMSAAAELKMASDQDLLDGLSFILKSDPEKKESFKWELQWAMQQAITDRIKESPDFLANVLSMLENFQPNVNQKNFTMTILERIRLAMKGEPQKFATATLDDGQEVTNGVDTDMAVGDSVFLVVDGENLPLPDGSYVLSTGEVFTVAGGVIETLESVEPSDMSASIASAVEAAVAPLLERISALEASKAEVEASLVEVATNLSTVLELPADEPIRMKVAAKQVQKGPRTTEDRVQSIIEKYTSK